MSSGHALRVILLSIAICSPALGNTVLWLTADEGTPGQPALSPTDSGDYSLTVAGENGVLYSADAAGVGAAASPVERSFIFDGMDDLIRVTDHAVLDLSGDYTIEFFMKLTGTYTEAAIWQLFERRAGAQEYSMLADPLPYTEFTTSLVGSTGGGGFGGTGSLPSQGNWHHIALVYDSSNTAREANLYVNGVFATGRNYVTGEGTNFSMTADLLFGRSTAFSGRDLKGLLDEIRITDVALQPSQFLNVVPEPGTVSLLVLATVLVGRARRRRVL